MIDPKRTALPFSTEDPFPFDRLARSLDRLALSSFDIRKRVIDGCAHTAFADREVTLEEGELLRVIAVSLDCPLPPFLAG